VSGLRGAIRSERIKLRRTLAKGLSAIAPVTAALLSLFVLANADALAAARHVAPWQGYMDSAFRVWASLLLPFCITLQAVLLAQIEHGNQQWKHLLALPVPRARIYAAKLVVLVALLLLASVLLAALVLGIAWAAGLVAIANGTLAAAAAHAALSAATIAGAALLLLAIQFLVSMQTSSFTAAIGFGTIATIVAVLATSTMGDFAYGFPWSMPAMVVGASAGTSRVIVCASLVAATLVSVAGMRLLASRRIG
jgi:hypothetical protein